MAHEIRWSSQAYDDLEAIFDYIRRDSSAVASAVVEHIVDRVGQLAEFPLMRPRMRERKRPAYRHLVEPPYRIVYRFNEGVVHVITIVHGARDLKKLLRMRGKPRPSRER